MTSSSLSLSERPETWSRQNWSLAAGLLVLATVIAYWPAVRGGFLWDDDAHVTKPELRSAHGLYRIWFDVGATQQYYPLLHSAFWVEHHLWGDWSVGYHLLNIALHCAAALLVMLIVRRLLADLAVPWADPAAFLTAAVFALHPVHVESVAWITEQKNTLSAVFYLWAMLTYLRFDRTRNQRSYVQATILFGLSLLSKPVTVTLPAALLVIFWGQRGRLEWKRDLVPLLPWFGMSIVSGLFAAWVEHDVIGAQGEAFHLTAVQRVLLPGRVAWFYLSKLLWPTELIFVYPRWTVDSTVRWQWWFPIGMIVTVILLAALSRKRRAPLAAMLFFVGSLFPVLGFFNVYLYLYTFVADHFQYLSSLGVIFLGCGAIAAAMSRLPWPNARFVPLLALPAILGVLTFRQCRPYADIQTMYEAVLEQNPNCWMAQNNLGIVLKDRGHFQEAINHYRRALALRPNYPEALNNLGVAQKAIGHLNEAVSSYHDALRLLPEYSKAMGNLISALIDEGRLTEAIEESEKAVLNFPDDARIRINFGIALRMAGRHQESVGQFEEAVRLRPDLVEAHANLATSYEATGRLAEAVKSGEHALNLARVAGQRELAGQIEVWLESCRARAERTGPSLP